MWEYLSNEEMPERPTLGYHNTPEQVWQWGSMLVLSGYQLLPDAGGWDDQFADKTDDLLNWLALRHYVQWQIDEEKGYHDKEGRARGERDPLDAIFGTGKRAGELEWHG